MSQEQSKENLTAGQRKRPYWKVCVSLLLSLLLTVLGVLVVWRLCLLFMPFVVAWIIACVVQPLVSWLECRLRLRRKISSAMIIVLVLVLVMMLLYFAANQLYVELRELVLQFPKLYQELQDNLKQTGERLQGVFHSFPEEFQEEWKAMGENLNQTVGGLIGKYSTPTMTAAGNLALQLPTWLINSVVTLVASYFFVAQREEVLQFVRKHMPQFILEQATMVFANLKKAVGGYFKAQLQIMCLVTALLFSGFLFLHINFSVILAILIGVLDFLPLFGTGTVLFPWAIYELAAGEYKRMAGLLILWGVTQLVRQMLQPKLVGDGTGMNPLVTLVLLYIGYKTGSVLGLVLVVPVGSLLINLGRAGAFDYILEDVRILGKGLLRFRK